MDRPSSARPSYSNNYSNNNNGSHDDKSNEMNILHIPPLSCRISIVSYSKPFEITCYSVEPDKTLHVGSRSQLKRYCLPPIKNINLDNGFPNKFITKGPVDNRINHLLASVKYVNNQRLQGSKPPIKPNICTWRGTMTRIMCVPYDKNEEWSYNVTKHNGVIYMCDKTTPESLMEMIYGKDERHQRFMYWGHKFEQMATTDKVPDVPPTAEEWDRIVKERDEEDVNTITHYCSVFASTLGKHRLLLAAEVDCLFRELEENEDPLNAYMELKTSRIIEHPGHQASFERYKLPKIWAQAYLAGVSRVGIGYRTDNGIVSHVTQYETLTLPRISRGKSTEFDPNRCIWFADLFLTWLSERITIDDATAVYNVSYSSEKQAITLLDPVFGTSECFVDPDF